MKTSQIHLSTQRQAPSDAEIISHQLMLRAGLIRRLAAGIYTWLPLGLRVLRKVEAIVRDEMDRSGAQEILMSGVLPAELWQESSRWDQYGPELLRFRDRHEREFCLGPTHEEIITDLVRREIRSYKQLPINLYQIQTKFRDEIRPRFGIMRAREFIMKDAYSFHMDQASLEETYDDMYTTYSRIFDRLGLKYRAVVADSGNIGGSKSHEFHVLAESGEDAIVFTEDGTYAANIEMASCAATDVPDNVEMEELQEVHTPGQHTIEEICKFLDKTPDTCLKTLIVHGINDELVALVIRGDHELNRVKAEKLDVVKSPLTMASATQVRDALGCDIGSIGPIKNTLTMIADHSAVMVSNFTCGANKNNYHITGGNWIRDMDQPRVADLRNIVEGDLDSEGRQLKIARGIEVGHIFQLGKKYSESMKASVLNESGESITLTMGCYGIGVSRIVAAAIEQNNDEKGIIWPGSIAPFQVTLLPMHMHKSQRLRDAVDELYTSLIDSGIEVLLDDRKERPGVMFADMELLGIPHRLVFSERGLDAGTIEYKGRCDEDSQDIPLDSTLDFIKDRTLDNRV